MRRKDGKSKLKAKRSLPEFEYGLRKKQSADGKLHRKARGDAASVVSLFTGCGGLDLGFEGGFSVFGTRYPSLPFRILAAYDNLQDAVDTYRLNLASKIHNIDLAKTDIEALPSCDVLTGGFPCQDFSSSGPKVGLSGERGALYTVIRDYLRAHQPKVAVGENVPYLARLEGGKYLRTILEEFEATGYTFRVWSLVGPEYGLPQSRRRLFLIGVRNDIGGFPTMPPPTHVTSPFTIDDAISDLESVNDETICNQSQYFVSTRATAGGGQGDHQNRRGAFAYCIRANARGRIQFHYELDRRLTVRECARLQSFPDEFIFPFTTQRNLTLIGNAVPPILGHAVARAIADFLANKAAKPRSVAHAESRVLATTEATPTLFASNL